MDHRQTLSAINAEPGALRVEQNIATVLPSARLTSAVVVLNEVHTNAGQEIADKEKERLMQDNEEMLKLNKGEEGRNGRDTETPGYFQVPARRDLPPPIGTPSSAATGKLSPGGDPVFRQFLPSNFGHVARKTESESFLFARQAGMN